MATREGIIQLFAVLSQGSCRPPPDFEPARALPVWVLVLGDVRDDDLIGAAVAYLRRREPWWPTPGALLALIPGAVDDGVDDADNAWGDVSDMVRRYGRYRPPFVEDGPCPPDRWLLSSDPRRKVALEEGLRAIGGWGARCDVTTETEMAARASFRNAYRTAIARGVKSSEWQSVGSLLDTTVGRLRALPGGKS